MSVLINMLQNYSGVKFFFVRLQRRGALWNNLCKKRKDQLRNCVSVSDSTQYDFHFAQDGILWLH